MALPDRSATDPDAPASPIGTPQASDEYVPAPPPGDGWFRVECSDAGLGGPGWMRCTSQGNQYESDQGRAPGAKVLAEAPSRPHEWTLVPDDIERVTYICTRASLANLAPCQVIVKRKSRWRRWRERQFRLLHSAGDPR